MPAAGYAGPLKVPFDARSMRARPRTLCCDPAQCRRPAIAGQLKVPFEARSMRARPRTLCHVLGAAAEFERALIQERTQAGRDRYEQDYAAGRGGDIQ